MASTIRHVQRIQRNAIRASTAEHLRRDAATTRPAPATSEAKRSGELRSPQRVGAKKGIPTRDVEQLDQIVGFGVTNPDVTAWLMRFPHLILTLIGLPMPPSFATLLCAPDLASLKDLAVRSVALIDEVGMPDESTRRVRFDGGAMVDIWAN